MNVFTWLSGRFSKRGKAMWLFERGAVRAKKHDHQGAVDDYTTALDMPETPSDVKCMALYNRALAHVAAGDDRKGADDLDTLVAMDEITVNVKTMARVKLAAIDGRASKTRA